MKSEEASGAASASDDGSGSKYHPPDLVAAESHVVELPGIEGATIDPLATATEIPKYLIGNAKTPSNLGKSRVRGRFPVTNR